MPAPHPSRPQRDGFLDAIRAIATCRVIVWHAYGAPLISWFIAAMPAMFFVFGSLLAASTERRSYWTVAFDRLRRVLLPLWLFTGVTWSAVALIGDELSFDAGRLLGWLLPLVDPSPTPWEGGWLSSPLWFLRMLVWLVILSPLLLPAMKRAPRLTLTTLAMSVLAFDFASRHEALVPAVLPTMWWKLGDVALYGAFAAAGFLHHRTGFASISPKRWLTLAACAAVAAACWRVTQPVPLGVVNNSHPLHLFVGVAWLSFAFAIRAQLTAAAAKPSLNAVIGFLTRRSITIYLWHTAVISGVIAVLAHSNLDFGIARQVVYLCLIAVGVLLSTMAFGWMEDLAAGRRPQLQPVRLPMAPVRATYKWSAAVVTVVVVTATTTLAPAGSGVEAAHRPPPIPSQQPPAPEFARASTVTQVPGSLSKDKLPQALKTAVSRWRDERGATGVQAMLIDQNGRSWSTTSGYHLDGKKKLKEHDSFDVASITKLMTAVLVYEAADEGLIELDAPLPPLGRLPDFPYNSSLTPRLLLSHQSGLVNYRDTARYIEDKNLVSTPVDAVYASSGEPLVFQPGAEQRYSSVNYLLLGFLIEQIHGRPYEDVLHDKMLRPLGLKNTGPLPSSPGEPSYSTAGTMTTMSDLTKMTRRVLRDRDLISQESFTAMSAINADSAIGAGTLGFCPCTIDDAGKKAFFSIGHYGSDSMVVYVPSLDVVVGLRVTDGLHSEGRLDASVDLIAQLAQMTHGTSARPKS